MKKIFLIFLPFLWLINTPTSIAQNGLNPSQISEMVEKHNYWRGKLGIGKVSWSAEVAKYAQEWAEKLALQGCNLRHRQNGKYGENIFWAMGIKITPSTVVDDWADERKDFNHHTQECNNGNNCGHYTQVIWANTNQIGCGMARCKDGAEIWVCNYDPPGNYMGEKPYSPNGNNTATNNTNAQTNDNVDMTTDTDDQNNSEAVFLNIQSINTKQCLNVKASMTQEGSPVILWAEEAEANSKWNVEEIDGSICKITVLHSGLSLSVNRRTNSLETLTFSNTNTQLWDIQPTEGGFLIKSLANQLYLAIRNGRITWVRNNQGNNAVWKIE
jgi:pathogenesis-related protein 1